MQCNVRTHAHRNKRQYLPLIVENWFVKISNFSTFSRLSLCTCAYCCNTRILKFYIWEYYTVVTAAQQAARLAQLGTAASIVGKSGSWVRNPTRPLFLCSSINFIFCIKSFLSCIYEQLAWTCGLANKLLTQFWKLFKIRFPAVINISI